MGRMMRRDESAESELRPIECSTPSLPFRSERAVTVYHKDLEGREQLSSTRLMNDKGWMQGIDGVARTEPNRTRRVPWRRDVDVAPATTALTIRVHGQSCCLPRMWSFTP